MPSASELCTLTLTEAAALVADKAVSPVDLTQACLERTERLNPALNAFITVTRDSALEQARLAEREIANGRYRGPLHGIPVALKDLIDTAGARTTAASALFQERVPAAITKTPSRHRSCRPRQNGNVRHSNSSA